MATDIWEQLDEIGRSAPPEVWEDFQARVEATNSPVAKEIAALSKDAERLDWLEQHAWATERECFDLVDSWRTPDGRRHGGGLRAAIDALMGHNVEVTGGVTNHE